MNHMVRNPSQHALGAYFSARGQAESREQVLLWRNRSDVDHERQLKSVCATARQQLDNHLYRDRVINRQSPRSPKSERQWYSLVERWRHSSGQ